MQPNWMTQIKQNSTGIPVEDLEGEGHELPALVADRRAGAAGPDVVVVRHVDVEDELLLLRLEVADLVVVARTRVVHRTHVDLVRQPAQHLFPERSVFIKRSSKRLPMQRHITRDQRMSFYWHCLISANTFLSIR